MTARRLAWLSLTLSLLLVTASVSLPPNTADGEALYGGWPLFILFGVQALTFATVGLVLARARPDNAVSWMFAGVGVIVALYVFVERYQHYALVVRPGGLPGGEFAAWLQTWLYVPALGIFVTLLPQLFPTGRPLSRRWYPAIALSVLGFASLALADATAPGVMDQSTIENPYGIDPDAHGWLSDTAPGLYLLSALVGFAAVVVRWRRAGPRQRQQLKWFAYFGAMLPALVIGSALVELFEVGEPLATIVLSPIVVTAFLGLPIAVAISILRYQLYDIDLVIKRTLVYGSLTAMLVATYLLVVLLLRLVLTPVIGESKLAVAGSTLAVAALFRPLRSSIQAIVDRRFYRARYNAGRTLEGFAGRLRDELDLESLGTDLRGVVHETMQPAHVSLWLRSTT